MPRQRNPFLMWMVGAASIGFGELTARLPLPVARGLGRGLARLAYYLIPRLRKVGLANLDLAYGNTLSRPEKTRILKDAVKNVGIVAAEFTRIPILAGSDIARLVQFDGLEHLDRSEGSLMVGAHLGNWEWMAPALASQGFLVAGVVRPLDHPALNAFVDRLRRSGHVATVPKTNAVAEVVQLLRKGYVVGLLVDQSPRENAAPVRFFGRETWGTVGAALASARTRLPVHVIAMLRQPNGSYLLRVSPEIPMARSGDLRADLVQNAQRCQDAVEALVRACPGQWLWFHRRWKARPRLQQEWRVRQMEDASRTSEQRSD